MTNENLQLIYDFCDFFKNCKSGKLGMNVDPTHEKSIK